MVAGGDGGVGQAEVLHARHANIVRWQVQRAIFESTAGAAAVIQCRTPNHRLCVTCVVPPPVRSTPAPSQPLPFPRFPGFRSVSTCAYNANATQALFRDAGLGGGAEQRWGPHAG